MRWRGRFLARRGPTVPEPAGFCQRRAITSANPAASNTAATIAVVAGLIVLAGPSPWTHLLVILGATGRGAPAGFAPLTIGLTLTLIHLISIPVTNTSVNPARSTGPAVFVGGWAIEQLWLFWLAPIVGAALAGVVHHYVIEERPETVEGYS